MKQDHIKTHCFIDYENVHESGFEGVEKLSDGDSVTIFISSVSHKISLVVLETLLRKKCDLKILHTIGTGKNNLDFQLIAEVGYQIGCHTHERESVRYAIISKDKGYENVVSAFANRGIQVLQCESIERIGGTAVEAVVVQEEIPIEPEWDFKAPIRTSLESLKLTPAELKRIDDIFKASGTLAALHDRLAKAFGKKGNHNIYSKLKTLHKRYQKTLPPEETQPEISLENPSEIPPENPLEVQLEIHSEAPSGLPASAPVVKKKTRGRKKNPSPAVSSDVAALADSTEAGPGEGQIKSLPPLSPPEDGTLENETEQPIPLEAQKGLTSAPAQPEDDLLPEQTEEKKKRKPGRPRKKNGTSKAKAEPVTHEIKLSNASETTGE